MEIYMFIIALLVGLAIFDLIVGVSNDAVNFLNSSIGSRVAPRHIIMLIASLGILAGVTFSSGMMEVARKGIFQPQLFLMSELIAIFLAVMLTDVLLLDLFNTFGLPTSTTVSIVFELLGAAVAISLDKLKSFICKCLLVRSSFRCGTLSLTCKSNEPRIRLSPTRTSKSGSLCAFWVAVKVPDSS